MQKVVLLMIVDYNSVKNIWISSNAGIRYKTLTPSDVYAKEETKDLPNTIASKIRVLLHYYLSLGKIEVKLNLICLKKLVVCSV